MNLDERTSPSTAPSPRREAPRLSRWQKFRLIVKVVELRLRFIAVMVITGLAFAYWDTIWNYVDKWRRPHGSERVWVTAGFEYFCPMHPQVIRDEPGACPICGMPLSKRKKGQKEALPQGVSGRVQLSPFRIEQAGIRTVEASFAPLFESITTVGLVVHDETRYSVIAARIKGMTRIEKLYVNYIGSPVEAGQPLALIYSPELYQATQELLLLQRAARDAPKPQTSLVRSLSRDPNELFQAAEAKLKLWGITQGQIDEILKQGKAEYSMPILAPLSGHVTKKNVVEGQMVPEGSSIIEIADISHVWIKAQVFEGQMALVRVGQAVEATVEAFPGEVFPGRVAFIDPELDTATRTVSVRYDLDNPDHRLRPGMYATVTLKTPVADTPLFRQRTSLAASTGPNGLTKLTAEQQKTCPVTGLKLGSMGDPVPVNLEGRQVWTCCTSCQPKLKAQPAKYLARLASPPKDMVLTVPESAVIDTGESKFVYVESEPGLFESREVVLGTRSGDKFPVLDGLNPGETVAARGAFLINAEERLSSGSAPAKNEPAPTDSRPAKLNPTAAVPGIHVH